MANKSIKDAFQRFWEYVTAKIDDQIMVVTITKNGDTYTADKTFAEIADKLDAGGKCEAVYVDGGSKWILPSVARLSGVLIFSSTDYTNTLSHNAVQMFDDGEIRYFDTAVSTGESEAGTLLVTVTKNGNTYTADRTFAEIIAELNAGGKCEAVLVDGSNKIILPSVSTYGTSSIFFGSTTYSSGLLNATISMGSNGSITYSSRSVVPQSGGAFTGAVETGTASTSDYYVRNIKFSETAETPTNEGDICFKLK